LGREITPELCILGAEVAAGSGVDLSAEADDTPGMEELDSALFVDGDADSRTARGQKEFHLAQARPVGATPYGNVERFEFSTLV
jgi:hypothetical protein